ncbi:Rho1 [Aphelenchoides avenae]|nr:Rho1 [Aphelenchus avenae]
MHLTPKSASDFEKPSRLKAFASIFKRNEFYVPTPAHKRVAVIGDEGCGKSYILKVIKQQEFPNVLAPGVYEHAITEACVDGKRLELHFIDTPGQDGYEEVRRQAYSKADVVVVCFSLDSPTSLENVKEKWVPEVRRYRKKAPIVLLGNKVDLRDAARRKHGKRFVSAKDGLQVASELGVHSYVECSARRMNCVEDLLKSTARAARRNKKIFSWSRGVF